MKRDCNDLDETTHAFLAAYERKLAEVRAPADVHAALADWLHGNRGAAVAGVVADLNAALGLPAGQRFQPHLPTAAIGALDGLVFVSANPGFRALANAREQAYRAASAAHNRAFCSDCDVFRGVTRSGWWTRCLGLAHLYASGGSELLPAAQRWPWRSASAFPVGNIDLIPFHSTADGFKLLRKNDPATLRLRSLAWSTLKMTLGLTPAPRLVFVGSPLGAWLAAELAPELGLVALADRPDDPAPFDRIRRYVHPGTNARLMTFPHQPFTSWFGSRPPGSFTWAGLAQRMREFAPCEPGEAARAAGAPGNPLPPRAAAWRAPDPAALRP